MTDSSRPGRRDFLRRSIAIVPAATALGAAGMVTAQNTGAPAARTTPPAPGAATSVTPYTPVYFNADEWKFLQAAVARLIPSDDTGPGAIEAGVPEFLDRQMESAYGHGALWYMQGPFMQAAPQFGYQGRMNPRELYRTAIAAIDAWCVKQRDGKRFANLAAAAQDEILTALQGGRIDFDDFLAQDYFALLLQNTKEGYFSDPIHGGNKHAAAWAMIGFPGARADFLDWVQRPGERYPLPPVSIAGPQG